MNRKTGVRATAIQLIGRATMRDAHGFIPLSAGTFIVDDAGQRYVLSAQSLPGSYAIVLPGEHWRDHDGFHGGPDQRCATNRKGRPRERRTA